MLIDPPQGNMRDYLDSLERMRSLPNLTVLLAVTVQRSQLRIRRSTNTFRTVSNANKTSWKPCARAQPTPKEIVAQVYTDVSPKAHAMAERAVLAHLEKLRDEGLHLDALLSIMLIVPFSASILWLPL